MSRPYRPNAEPRPIWVSLSDFVRVTQLRRGIFRAERRISAWAWAAIENDAPRSLDAQIGTALDCDPYKILRGNSYARPTCACRDVSAFRCRLRRPYRHRISAAVHGVDTPQIDGCIERRLSHENSR